MDNDSRNYDYSHLLKKKITKRDFSLDNKRKEAAEYAAKALCQGESNLQEIKKEASKKFSLQSVLRNSDILAVLSPSQKTKRILSLLLKTPTRTLSGVSPVAVMPKPFPCVGFCTYCPKGIGAPQSYTGFEPMTMRAIQNNYDPKKQVLARLKQYSQQGHPTDKCHLILMGGTFLAVPKDYRHKFVKECYDAFNGFDSPTIEESKKANEKATHRVIGVTFETRPDWCFENEIDDALLLGGTQMELGVQTLSDEVYKKVKRGHTVSDVKKATDLLKNSAFKVCYHMMLGLFASPQEDEKYFRTLFSDPDFKPDMLKIYPTLVLEGTPLYEQYKRGEFSPYTSEEAAEVILRITKYFPPYVRVMRVQRDIPSNLIHAGVKHSNLRQLVDQKLKRAGILCQCVRCREIGNEGRGFRKIGDVDLSLERIDYEANGGHEIFLSFEDKRKHILAAFCRLRVPPTSHRPEITDKTALIRELHVYGAEVEIGQSEMDKIQHKGLGKKLLAEAEKISREEFEKRKLLIISGAGARPYYYKLGYIPDGAYVSKSL
ncbi:MAG: tRNA uridine(34) 5-carboxymethylaminomethyl modification radical SAM/GNAT enzyme Elp3 [Candidatus Anstonellales archaeon]